LTWWQLVILLLLAITLFSLALLWLVRWLGRREPYHTFLGLRTRRKLTFFRLLLRDRDHQVPLYVKLIPLALIAYLSIPFDLIPDFIPVLGYLDDVAVALLALVLIVRFTPAAVIWDFLREAAANAEPPSDPSPEDDNAGQG
jgi:uncharacterized membrane protein YkvA (DUF1232 family)